MNTLYMMRRGSKKERKLVFKCQTSVYNSRIFTDSTFCGSKNTHYSKIIRLKRSEITCRKRGHLIDLGSRYFRVPKKVRTHDKLWMSDD